MSQEKVDYRKSQKYNRKKILKKQKRQHVLGILASIVIVLALGGWVGFSAYTSYQEKKAETITYNTLDASSLSDYLQSLGEE